MNYLKIRHLLLTIIVNYQLSIIHCSHAQTTFQKTFGGGSSDYGKAVEQTTDGGYIVAGYTESFGAGSNDVYLIKTHANGDMMWTKTYGGAGTERAYAVEQTTDGGYIVAGWTISFGAGSQDVYLIKTDFNGDTLWIKTYGGASTEWAYAVEQTTDGGYIVAGYAGSFGAGSNDVYLIKTNANGDTLWTKTYGGANLDEAHAVQQTTDGGYIVAGTTNSFGSGGNDVYLIKTNANGNTLWTRTYGGMAQDVAYAVQQTTDGGYIVVGITGNFGAGSTDVYLIKTDSLGDTTWTKTYGGFNIDYGFAVQQTTDGGYIVAGYTYSFGAGSADFYIIKTDANGDTLWTRTYGGMEQDVAYAVRQTTDGRYIVAGFMGGFWSRR